MQHEIYLIRHAQSADKQSGQTDKQRFLTPAGNEEAKELGNFLNKRKLFPDLIMTSSAQRAMDTASIISGKILFPVESIQKTDELYEAIASKYIELIQGADPSCKRILIVGHNPAISGVACLLTNSTIELKPCELVGLTFDLPWKEIAGGTGRVSYSFHPVLSK